jgi:hypothetical protein
MVKHIVEESNKYKTQSIALGRSIATNQKVVSNLVKWGVSGVSTGHEVIKQAHETLFDAERSMILKKLKK